MVIRQVITVNGARFVKPDIQATNGVIHIVDRVLFPVPQADIYNTLKNDPAQRYTTLISAIDKAGLTTVLANPTGKTKKYFFLSKFDFHEHYFPTKQSVNENHSTATRKVNLLKMEICSNHFTTHRRTLHGVRANQ